MSSGYAYSVGGLLRVCIVVLVVYGGLLALTYVTFQRAPTGFIPQQDQGRLIANIQLPDSASLERTKAVVAKIEDAEHRDRSTTPGIAHTVAFAGSSFLLQANSSNFASMFIVLDPFDKRQKPELRDTAIMNSLSKACAEKVPEAQFTVLGASAIPGLGIAGGFKFIVEDRGDLGLVALQQQTDGLIQKLQKVPGLSRVTTQFRSKTPQLFLDIDRDKAASLGVSLDDVNQTLDMFMGSRYVNSFNDFGRHWQVTVQADGSYRNRVEDLNLFQVRNKFGQMVLLGTLVHPREIAGPIAVPRYNLYTAASVSGNIQTGYSTGEAIKTIDQIAGETLAPFHEGGLDRADVPAEAGGRHVDLRLLPGHRQRVPGLVGALRELVAAAGGDPGRAVVPALFRGRRALHAAGRQHLRADRPGRAGRAGVQECDPRGRVCQAVAPGGPLGLRGHQGGLAAAAAADPHDLVRLHLRRHSLDDRLGGRGGDAPLAGDRRLQRHVRRDACSASSSRRCSSTSSSGWASPACSLPPRPGGLSPASWAASLGLAGGFLLGKLGVVRLPWSALVGACAGVLVVLAILEIHRRIKPKADRIRVQTCFSPSPA